MPTLFFDLQILEEDTLCNPVYLVIALQKFYKGIYYPKNTQELYKPVRRMKPGSSFLLNPKSFFEDSTTDPIYKAQYIRLAGRRDYSLYKSFGTKSLDLALYPDLLLKNIGSNPLLTVANRQITFKYEE